MYKKRPQLNLPQEQRLCKPCTKRLGRKILRGAGSSREHVTYYYCPECKSQMVVPRPPRERLENMSSEPKVERR